MLQAEHIQPPRGVHDKPTDRAKKNNVYPCIVVCICPVMLVIKLPGSSSSSPFDTRVGWSTCNTLDFVPAEFQDTILKSTNAHLQTTVPSRWARVSLFLKELFELWMVIPEVLRLQTNKLRVMITSQLGERHTSSSFCFIRTFCFPSIPRRTRFAALLRSALRTRDSPLPIFVFSASSNTRPSSAFRRWEPVRFSSSGFSTPDRSRVWINLCRSASFCRFDLRLD